MSIMVPPGKGASIGVLFRNGEAIETLRKVDTLVVDKTGTLTQGKPRLMTVHAISCWTEEQILSLAAGLEKNSEHPLSAAILSGAIERKVTPADINSFRSITGEGVTGEANGAAIALGNAQLLTDLGIRRSSRPVLSTSTSLKSRP